jgi:DNA-binding NarL/FixJ family response regulator
VVVADHELPRIDGAELLREVKRPCPDRVRIVPSHSRDQAALERTLN